MKQEYYEEVKKIKAELLAVAEHAERFSYTIYKEALSLKERNKTKTKKEAELWKWDAYLHKSAEEMTENALPWLTTLLIK